MIIKRHRNNEYILVEGGLWVRNLTKKAARPLDINNLISELDMKLMVENEVVNQKKMYQRIETEDKEHDNILITGGGSSFSKYQHLLEGLRNVTIIAVNDALKQWNNRAVPNYYVVNNPYKECLHYLPKKFQSWPQCIASCRTNSNFLENYQHGRIYIYTPTKSLNCSSLDIHEAGWFIDDYRNSVCAAIGLSYKFKAKRILLLSCDDFYEKERPGTIKIKDNLWSYPQQLQAHHLIDGNLYWLRKEGIKLGYLDNGLEYNNCAYITGNELTKFFLEE